MLENENIIKDEILECLESVGIDANLALDSDNKNILALMDSLQYISFVAEIENYFKIELIDEFMIAESFKTFADYATKLEYYVKGWRQSYHNNFSMKEGELNEIEEVEKIIT